MAQTKRKRRRKHRGTPAGTIEKSAHNRGARGARPSAAGARGPRPMREPSWRSAANKAAIAAVIFGVLLVLLFKRPVGVAAAWVVIVFFLYVPVSYWTDRVVYKRRKAKLAAGRQR